ncbi:MAG: hypothetical protein R6V85_10860 [Polyangia bacterium]
MRITARATLTIPALLALTLVARPAAAEPAEEPIDTGLHTGVGLSVHQAFIAERPVLVPELEFGVIIAGIADVYLSLGLDIRRESFEDDNRESISTAGALAPELGARFIIGEPRPGGAYFFAGLAASPVVGIGSYESDGEDDEYYEQRIREYMDRFDIGLLMGVEYLLAASFGIGAEAGFVVSINNLEETDRETPDEHMQLGFFVPFSIRAAYHF